MCGFSGFIDISRKMGLDECRSVVTRMADRLAHRGPDDSGIWVDIEAGVALGHRRLSIINFFGKNGLNIFSAGETGAPFIGRADVPGVDSNEPEESG